MDTTMILQGLNTWLLRMDATMILIVWSIVLLVTVPVYLLVDRRGGRGSKRNGKGGGGGGRRPPSAGWEWPVLGHIHLLRRCFEVRFVEEKAKELGGVYEVRLGRVRTIFVAKADIAQEALVRKAQNFAKRPQGRTLGLLTSNFRDINTTNGHYWQRTRRNLQHQTLSASTLRSYSASRRHHLRRLPLLFSHQSNSLVPVHDICRLSIYAISASLCFGYLFDEHEDHILKELSHSLEKIASLYFPVCLSDLYPFLRPFLFPNLFQRISSATEARSQILRSLIQRHREAKACSAAAFIPGSYVETLLPMMEIQNHAASDGSGSSSGSDPLSMDDIVALCTEFLEASVASTATAVEWTMAHLVKDPLVQDKLYRHICDVVGDRDLEEEDLPNLPYLRAVVMESLRLHPPARFLLPHAVFEECELGGYDIGPSDVVYFCVTAMSRDPEVWEEPMVFRPERMLSAEMGLKKMNRFTFGAGRRICPGSALGQMIVELFVGRLVQTFVWLTPSSPHNPDEIDTISEHLSLSVRMANPLLARIQPRPITSKGVILNEPTQELAK